MSRRTWFTSDHHFGHRNIIKYCSRPYRGTSDMDKDLLRRWNGTVSREDTVYCLGDMSFNPKRYVGKLNGRIVLIQGNHDARKHNGLYQEAHDWKSLKIGGFKCLLNHRPIGVSDPFEKRQWQPSKQLSAAFGQHDFVICGHVHEKWFVNGKNVNVGVDIWGMTPISEARLLDCLKALRGGVTFVPESAAAKTQRLLEIMEADECQSPQSHPAWDQIVSLGQGSVARLTAAAKDPERWIPAELLKKMGQAPENRRETRRLEQEDALRKEGKSFREVRRRTGR